jgi:hypothetical protein
MPPPSFARDLPKNDEAILTTDQASIFANQPAFASKVLRSTAHGPRRPGCFSRFARAALIGPMLIGPVLIGPVLNAPALTA